MAENTITAPRHICLKSACYEIAGVQQWRQSGLKTVGRGFEFQKWGSWAWAET